MFNPYDAMDRRIEFFRSGLINGQRFVSLNMFRQRLKWFNCPYRTDERGLFIINKSLMTERVAWMNDGVNYEASVKVERRDWMNIKYKEK
jgi:hypothetical protein